jgi:hypothetical protein
MLALPALFGEASTKMPKDPLDEHVVILPDGEELRLSYDPLDGQQEQETLIEVDPVIEAFLRSPYDPVVGMMAFGRLTGEVVRNPPRTGWMLPLTILVGVACVSAAISALGFLYGSDTTLDMGWFQFKLYESLIVSLPFTLAGALILWRLARR